ncbi:MAG: hypothetical protein KF685_13300 [Acidobacteria bacterium]|nr:hypothetical protein [Acidobacteriota bacterium]
MSRLRIRKIGILSAAKIQGVMMFIMSLLISIPYGLIIIAFSLFGAGFGQGSEALAVGGGGVVMGIVVMIALPIFYAIIGFVFGALGALVYNILASIVGGIELEVENIA